MTGTPAPVWTGGSLSDAEYNAIARLLAELRSFDLHSYKDGCARRRIAKRLRTVGMTTFTAYLERLRREPDELDALVATISIHVSQFFRDPATFQTLEADILPELCRQVRAAGRDTLRLWSIGCASGEEPYSLALLLDELQPAGLQTEILGTDISQPVLQLAREALYEPERLREVPAEVLHTYFQAEAGRFRLRRDLRDRVRFARHNIMTADSWPLADLILCRYVLIYFSRAEQDRILTRLADCLSPFGVLVLGRSEVPGGATSQMFRRVTAARGIYRRSTGPA